MGNRRDSSGWTAQYSDISSEVCHSFSFMAEVLYQIRFEGANVQDVFLATPAT